MSIKNYKIIMMSKIKLKQCVDTECIDVIVSLPLRLTTAEQLSGAARMKSL